MAVTIREKTKEKGFSSWEIFTPFPMMARTGKTKRKMTTTPPIKLPTKMSGFLLVMAVRPRAISGMEVRKPNMKKEAEKEEIFSFLEKRITDLTIRSAPNQMATNEARKRINCKNIIVLEKVY